MASRRETEDCDVKQGLDVVQSPGLAGQQSNTSCVSSLQNVTRKFDLCLIYRHGDKEWVKTDLQKHIDEMELSVYVIPPPHEIEQNNLVATISELYRECALCLFICSSDSKHPEGEYAFMKLLDYTMEKIVKGQSTRKLIVIGIDPESSSMEDAVDPLTCLDWTDGPQERIIVELLFSVSAKGIAEYERKTQLIKSRLSQERAVSTASRTASEASSSLTLTTNPRRDSPVALESISVSEPYDPRWFGGILELQYIGTTKGSSFHQTIGREGGQLTAGSVSITVPPGAVQSPTEFCIESFVHRKRMPSLSGTGDMQVLSPVIFLHPHCVTFTKPVKFCLKIVVDVQAPGWMLNLMRSESARDCDAPEWHRAVAYKSTRQESKSRFPFDMKRWEGEVDAFSWWTWVGGFKSDATSQVRRKVGCWLLGQCLGRRRWVLSVHIFNSCEEMAEQIRARYKVFGQLPAIELCPPREISIRRSGFLFIEPQSGFGWSLVRGRSWLQLPVSDIWQLPFNAERYFSFVIESDSPATQYLEFPIDVKYVRRSRVEYQCTLGATHKLNPETDLLKELPPPGFPCVPDYEDEAYFFVGPDGLQSSNKLNLPPLSSPLLTSPPSQAASSSTSTDTTSKPKSKGESS